MGGVLYVPMIKARTPMMMQPLIPNVLGEFVMMVVIPAKAPSAMAVLHAGSVASLNLSSMGEERVLIFKN
jgi:hypothetical protein